MKTHFVCLLSALVLFLAAMPVPAACVEDPPIREVKVNCDAPATNYAIKIQSVWRVGDELWVVSQINKTGDVGGAAITAIQDRVKVRAAEGLKVRHHIAGKTWNWWQGDEAQFIDSRDALLEQMGKDKVEIDEVLFGPDPGKA